MEINIERKENRRGPGFLQLATDVASVQGAAEDVAADRPLLDQRAAVQAFFELAATAVRAMALRGT